MSNRSSAPHVAYALYGEESQALMPDYLHYETIRERSSKHNWEITRHRHENLAQVFVFHTPDVTIRLGEEETRTSGPLALFVPPMQVHGFQFRSSVEGGVITLTAQRLDQALAFLDLDRGFLRSPVMLGENDPQFAEISRLESLIAAETTRLEPFRYQALSVHFLGIVLALQRAVAGRTAPYLSTAADRQERQVRRFCELVEENYARHWRVADYAVQLGMSEAQLTRACRRVLGLPPRRFILNRVILQAKRELAYTPRTVSEIAFFLGFRDVGYFSRFFTRMTGSTPTTFRSRTRQSEAA